MEGLHFLKNVSWEDVFRVWQSQEGLLSAWQNLAKEKGWSSWEAWRGYQAEQFNCAEREWKLYEITQPNKTIPKFRVGPFKSWQAHFEEKNKHTFEDLVRVAHQWVSENKGVKHILGHFPHGSQMIGLLFESTGEVVLFEGHHRAAAIALAVYEGRPMTFSTSLNIALTSISIEDEPDIMEKMKKIMERGTDKASLNEET